MHMHYFLVVGLFLLLAVADADEPSSIKKTKLDNIVTSIENDLEFDENNKLATHYVVFPANRPDCPTGEWETMMSTPGVGFKAHPVEGDALAKVFPEYDYTDDDEDDDDDDDDDRCFAACLEKGTDIQVAGHTMPHFHYEKEAGRGIRNESTFHNWFQINCRRVEVCFMNYVTKDRPLDVFWINENKGGTKVLQASLKYSEQKTHCFEAFLGHTFEAIDEESGFHERFTIEHATSKAFGTSPPSSSRTIGGEKQLERQVKHALHTEWHKHIDVERTFSSLGFDKGKLPDDVFANMGAFYYNNRGNAVNEEWDGKGLFVNWWETDVKFVTIPWQMKQKWQLRLSELVRVWAGVDVEETSMYGFRQYETGARLLSHVDRLPTHAVSLIVNIAQDNLASPWPVEVFDHADRLHEITLEPGEIVYYESAKNLHSRNRPLTCKHGGCRYINLFTHYRPVGDGDRWHTNLSDLPNRPPPLLEGQVDYDTETSACRRRRRSERSVGVDNNNDDDDGNIIGVGTVECNDDRLGSYISPTLFKAKSADDLFKWWLATKDPNFIGFGDEHDIDIDNGIDDGNGNGNGNGDEDDDDDNDEDDGDEDDDDDDDDDLYHDDDADDDDSEFVTTDGSNDEL